MGRPHRLYICDYDDALYWAINDRALNEYTVGMFTTLYSIQSRAFLKQYLRDYALHIRGSYLLFLHPNSRRKVCTMAPLWSHYTSIYPFCQMNLNEVIEINTYRIHCCVHRRDYDGVSKEGGALVAGSVLFKLNGDSLLKGEYEISRHKDDEVDVWTLKERFAEFEDGLFLDMIS